MKLAVGEIHIFRFTVYILIKVILLEFVSSDLT